MNKNEKKFEVELNKNAVYRYDSASKVGGLLAIQYVNRKAWTQDLKT
jgi:hypothetical protein